MNTVQSQKGILRPMYLSTLSQSSQEKTQNKEIIVAIDDKLINQS